MRGLLTCMTRQLEKIERLRLNAVETHLSTYVKLIDDFVAKIVVCQKTSKKINHFPK